MFGRASCKFCGGRPGGCVACAGERAKRKAESGGMPVPMFVAKLDNPGDIELLADAAGRKAMEKAYGPGGGGEQEIGRNLAIASFVQAMRERKIIQPDPSSEPIMSHCPSCGNEQEDADGFGVVHCEGCGHCVHPSASGGICDICGRSILE